MNRARLTSSEPIHNSRPSRNEYMREKVMRKKFITAHTEFRYKTRKRIKTIHAVNSLVDTIGDWVGGIIIKSQEMKKSTKETIARVEEIYNKKNGKD